MEAEAVRPKSSEHSESDSILPGDTKNSRHCEERSDEAIPTKLPQTSTSQ